MPRMAVQDNSRMSLRIRAEEKALLLRAVALNHTDLTDFVLRHALMAAKAVIQEAEHVQLSGRENCEFSISWKIPSGATTIFAVFRSRWTIPRS